MKVSFINLRDITYLASGGPAHVWHAATVAELKAFTEQFHTFRVLGNGSNVIVSSAGLTEPALMLDGDFKKIKLKGNDVIAGAGAGLKDVIKKSAAAGLCGLENLSGIPASVGGAVFKNAGAFGSSISDVLKWVRFYRSGREYRISGGRIKASYRTGPVPIPAVISEACFSLRKKAREKIIDRIKDLTAKRKEKGFIYKNGSGCIFRNPAGMPAGKLIEQCGCSRWRSVGVSVSPLHANVFVLRGASSADDAYELMSRIRARVYEAQGVYLEPLVEFWGRFGK
ncbi:MAG: FAD-binding protein [Candidatus Omnitrophota bacterium]|nr:FAD-binding protein [Candidatus Omnitrophota bacterium]MBU2528779.1 FAD-binding protein [bacterium]MBU3929106.1 FAD-binding protein [bacterium]